MPARQQLDPLFAVLGTPGDRYADPQAWARLEGSLGFGLPGDYKRIVDAYAPIEINGHLVLHHPASERWNLGEWISATVDAWSQVPWGEVAPEGDPRVALGTTDLRFGTKDGLLPCASTNRGETLFFAPGSDETRCRIFIEDGEGEFFEFSISFAEWLLRYVSGEDMAGPGSAAFYPGPVKLRSLPVTSDERPRTFDGPERGR